MPASEADILGALECHDLEEMNRLLAAGWDVREPVKGKSTVNTLLEMYSRSDRFPDCLRRLLDRGGTLDDPALLPVLLDDADGLTAALKANPALLKHRTNLLSCFTPLVGATLLHVACEYGHALAAKALIDAGADVNAPAATDEHGLNGHTPIFHVVNANRNRPEPILRVLLAAGARADFPVKGITWGQGFEWETTCFDVTPISYAQCGLYPQFQRTERDTYHNIGLMLESRGRPVPPLTNVPNKYLFPNG